MFRWVICPVITFGEPDIPGDSYRCPKVATLTDPGRGNRRYMFSSAIDVGNWCLCQVSGIDFSTLDADAEVLDLLQLDYNSSTDPFRKTLRNSGLTVPRVNRLRMFLTNKGIVTTGLTIDSTIEEWLDRISKAVSPNNGPVRYIRCLEV